MLIATAFWEGLLRRDSGEVAVEVHEGDGRDEKTLRYTIPGLLTTQHELAVAFDLMVRLVETMGDWLPEDSN